MDVNGLSGVGLEPGRKRQMARAEKSTTRPAQAQTRRYDRLVVAVLIYLGTIVNGVLFGPNPGVGYLAMFVN